MAVKPGPCTHSKRKDDAFHMHCLRHILGISWRDHVPSSGVLERVGVVSMYTLLKQCCLCWLGHISCMQDSHILKDLLYVELASGKRPMGRPQLCYKDVFKHDLKSLGISTDTFGAVPANRSSWKQEVQRGLSKFEEGLTCQADERLQMRHKSIGTQD